jgi:hypothetical protein
MRRLLGFVVVAAVLVGLGCSSDATKGLAKKDKAKAKGTPRRASQEEARFANAEVDEKTEVEHAKQEKEPAAKDKAAQRPAPAGAKKPVAISRKIIYTGKIALVAEDFDKAEEKFRELIDEYKGYIAGSDVSRVPGEPQHGTWTVRIPADRSDAFRADLRNVGKLVHSKLDSQDVTDQYFDTQAEQTNLEVREKALRGLYDKTIANAKLTDLLEVDRELARVRGEINTLKGRLQRWDKLVAYATYTVTIDERRSTEEAPAAPFGIVAGERFGDSLSGLTAFGRFLLLFFIILSPWLVLLAVILVPVWLVVRRKTRPVLATLAPAEQSPPAATPPPPG